MSRIKNKSPEILFITSSRIGDAVLSTGLLSYISENNPKAKITIVCGPLAASLFEGVPNVKEIIPLKKEKHHKHWLKLWQRIIKIRWHTVVDLRDSAVSRVVFAKKRFIFGRHIDKSKHKVEQNARVMNLNIPPSPMLWFTAKQLYEARQYIPQNKKIIAIGPAANWHAKTWPAENFIKIIKYLTESKNARYQDAHIAILAAPGEEHVANTVLQTIPKERRIDLIAKLNPAAAAAAISLCNLYIGNDSGLMHCAAASGIKTLGLFGPSYPHIYRPWGKDAHYVSTPQGFDELIAYDGYEAKTAPCLMHGITVEMVQKKLDDIL